MSLDAVDRSLRYFLCIAQLGSLSRAAEVLDQGQSSLSKQLRMLEDNVGQALFVRTGRGVLLTDAGEKLYAALRPAYRDIDMALQQARYQGVSHGTVRLATVHTLSYYFGADVVARFLSVHPQVNLSLLGRSSPEVVDLVDSGKADLGFVYDVAVDIGTVRSWPLFEEDMSLIVLTAQAMDGPVDLTANEVRLVGFPSHYALRRMIHSSDLKARFVAEAETIDAMLHLVATGVGCCILPSRIPDELLADQGLKKVPIARPALRRRMVAITPAYKPVSPLTQQLLDLSRQVAEKFGAAAPFRDGIADMS